MRQEWSPQKKFKCRRHPQLNISSEVGALLQGGSSGGCPKLPEHIPHAAAFLVSLGNCGSSPVAISHSSVMLREWVKGIAFALYYSSEGSLLSRAENLPPWSSISQHTSLSESFKNAQLSQCTHWGSTAECNTIECCTATRCASAFRVPWPLRCISSALCTFHHHSIGWKLIVINCEGLCWQPLSSYGYISKKLWNRHFKALGRETNWLLQNSWMIITHLLIMLINNWCKIFWYSFKMLGVFKGQHCS